MRCWNSRPYAASAMGGTTSTRVTRPSTDTQNFTWYVRPTTEPETLAGGGRAAARGEAGKMYLASSPVPDPTPAPAAAPGPAPRPPAPPPAVPPPPLGVTVGAGRVACGSSSG